MTGESGPERIGLLFVHGIGEQQRWEHLKASVHELAELLLQTGGQPRVNVTDRTERWPHPAGHPDPDGIAPISIDFTAAGKRTVFECHEVWWADLGARAGIGDTITFWLWGLGQWSAPIYRELDAAALPKEQRQGTNKPTSKYATLPESVAGNLLSEPLSRLQLALAALAALFVACTWSLAKRLFAGLLGQAPTPTLIVRYVGDVRTYESRAAPGDSALSDPGRPRRVGLRRRMVSEMIALGTGSCDGWYVLAHSLGTVLAYNGLTETGHALPNYLTEEQWGRVPGSFRRDPGCARRDDVSAMMPARPPWLVDEDVIDRPLLFEKLRGFLTYGSPLDKFAALWPRIVATATDRKDGSCAFPRECRWINLVAPSDPVAGTLDSFGNAAGQRLEKAIPTVENRRAPWNPHYGLSHIEYFSGAERHIDDKRSAQKRTVAKWLLEPGASIPDHPQGWLGKLVGVHAAYPLLVAFLWAATAAFIILVLDTLDSVVGQGEFSLGALYRDTRAALGPVLAAALAIVFAMGLLRWAGESRLNVRLAQADKKGDSNQSPERRQYWDRIIRMLRAQWIGAMLMMVIALAATLFAVALDWGYPTDPKTLLTGNWRKLSAAFPPAAWREVLDGWWTLSTVSLGLLLSAIVQTLLNRIVPPVGKAPG